jgi:hypothetical protein
MSNHASLRTVIKENMRNARFLAREVKGSLDRLGRDGEGLPQTARALAELSDKALSRLESLALSIASADPRAHAGHVIALPLALLAKPTAENAELVARTHYAAAKALLIARGVHNPSVSELAFAKAYELAAAAIGDDDREADASAPSRHAAQVAVAIAGAQPVASPAALSGSEGSTQQDANLVVAAILALSMLVVSINDDLTADEGIYEAAAIAVDIRYDDFAEAMRGSDDLTALAGLLAEIAPHLP